MNKFNDQLSESYTNLTEKLTTWLNDLILQLPNILVAVLVAVIAFFFAKYIRKFVNKMSSKFIDNRTVINLISNLSTVIFSVISLFIILTILNLDETINKILATAGVLGLAVGLALQDPMNNLFSGVTMSVRKLYKIGDLIESNGFFGIIADIDLRSTKIKLPEGQIVTIPNKDVIQKPLVNYSSSGLRRIDLECGVSYAENLDSVSKVVKEAISSLENVMIETGIDVMFTSFGSSSINFVVRYWITTDGQKDYLKEKSNGIQKIKAAFDENNILIPFPITTLDFGIKGGTSLKKMIENENNFKNSLN